jgi:hypothetical protein
MPRCFRAVLDCSKSIISLQSNQGKHQEQSVAGLREDHEVRPAQKQLARKYLKVVSENSWVKFSSLQFR